MKRLLIYEERASKWSVIYFMTFPMILPALVTAGYGFTTANGPLAIGFSMLCVFIYFVASGASRKAQYWASRAFDEQRFETLETLPSPRSHAASNNDNN